MLYISAMDHARMLKFSSYVHLPSINKMFQYRYAWVILCSVGRYNLDGDMHNWANPQLSNYDIGTKTEEFRI